MVLRFQVRRIKVTMSSPSQSMTATSKNLTGDEKRLDHPVEKIYSISDMNKKILNKYLSIDIGIK